MFLWSLLLSFLFSVDAELNHDNLFRIFANGKIPGDNSSFIKTQDGELIRMSIEL